MSAGEPPRKRRPRYAGTHPRRFEEKYKEKDPIRFPDEREKVLASGKTPAGSHVPILVNEVLEALAPRPGEVFVDGTLGWGGHAEAVLGRLLPGGRLVGLDVDTAELPRTVARLRGLGFDERMLTGVRRNFAGLRAALDELGLPAVNGILLDLGVSSMQIDDPARGFSIKRDGPLDLRMDPARGAPAHVLLERLSEKALEKALAAQDEEHAALVARAIGGRRGEIRTTQALKTTILEALSSLSERERRDLADLPVRRAFQALRILVNGEDTALDAFLAALPSCLVPGGRVAILSFHSGEDRAVKKAFQSGFRSGVFAAVSPEVVRASPEERRANPRSTSAKLRWAIRA
ncbi:MAG: 16S rRNA (cytosine(1402)-N(4))-methyltransferase RsmH [Acidobacteria bacterium]|nr:16S rRNA (cytosine(1402)-N(4))-methyltransferase RsmH [Acidobacteriota bacterium]